MLLVAYVMWFCIAAIVVVGVCYCAGAALSAVVRWNDKRYERACAYRARCKQRALEFEPSVAVCDDHYREWYR